MYTISTVPTSLSRRTLGGRRRRAIYVATLVVSVCLFHQLSYLGSILPTNLPITLIESCNAHGTDRINHGSKIPRIFHQTWTTTNLSSYPQKPSYDAWEAVLRPLNYTMKIWSDADILHLIQSDYPWVLSTYKRYDLNIQRADLARLVVLHSEGGIYADLDVYPVVVDEITCLCNSGIEGLLVSTRGSWKPSNHFIMAVKGCPFLSSALKNAVTRASMSRRILLPYLRVFWSTGPMMIDSALQQYMSTRNSSEVKMGLAEEAYASRLTRHAAGRSWHGLDGYLLNLVSDHAPSNRTWLVLLFGCCFLVAVFHHYPRTFLYLAVRSSTATYARSNY